MVRGRKTVWTELNAHSIQFKVMRIRQWKRGLKVMSVGKVVIIIRH